MDKEFEKKVRQKRIRAIAMVLVVIAVVIYLIQGTKVEKADYTDSLNDEIKTAQTLYEENKVNVGNGKDQYAKYTVLKFEKQIEKAEEVAKSEISEYNDKKEAYETLKEQVKAFEKGTNDPVIEKEEAETLAKEEGRKELSCEIKNKKEITYTIRGKNLKKPVTMNLTAREEGPYYEEINEVLKDLSLQGQVISFYQEGTFGGDIQVETPIYSEKATKGYTYKIDLGKGKLNFVSEAEIDLEEQTAVFTVEEGGDYVVLTKKIHKDGNKKAVDIEEAEKKVEEQQEAQTKESDEQSGFNDEDKGSDKDSDDDSDKGKPANQPAEEDNTITVSIEIRCDTLAADLSKLRDPSLEAYVPADGTILPVTEVEVEKGASVYDVLDKVCRNKNIQMEATYTPNYGADYIEGINYLYEFDGGEQSGWMFKVNGVFPNYGCSEYILEKGDSIVWAYTCNMGKDLGK